MQSVVVVGAGLSGICIGIKLKQAGIHDFVILEKAQEVGGTWRENQYPGVACDVPSHLYSYSFEQNPEWSKTYSCGQEIQDYCVRCTDKYDIRQHIRFGVEIKQGTFDGQCWRLTSSDGDVFASQALVLAIGGLHTPSYPEIKGLSGFEGRMFHSAKWDTQYDVQDKSVAIIGSAASAVQIVPGIVDRVKSLQVFQRTANWILPRHEKVYSAWAKALFRYVPGLQRAYRWLIYWLLEWRVSVFLKPGSFWSRTVRRLALAYLEETVTDPVLRQQLTPDYDPGCKRILVSDDYFQALQDDKASLVVEPIASIEPRGIRTQDGQLHPCDALVLATGFRPFSFEENLDLVNEEGLSLSESWKDRMEAHMTVTVPKFPNLYLMLGPNSGLGHNSIIFMIEVQVRYILQCLQAQARRKLSSLVPTSAAARQYNDDLQKAMRTTVWAGSCQSWYKDSTGHNHTLWPGSTVQYWWRLRRPKLVSEYSQDGKS